MNNHKIFRLGPPAFYITTIGEEALANLHLSLVIDHKEVATRVIRGRKSGTLTEFFNEASAALQFPYYFGENWPAFDECIKDLEWIPADAYFLIISESKLLLCEEEDFRILIEILASANKEWLTPNQYIPRNRPATPFHVLFQCAELDLAAFSKRLAGLNTTAENL